MKKPGRAGLLAWLCLACVSGCGGFLPAQGPQLALHEVHPFGAKRIAFSPSGTRLASGGLRGEVQLWSLPDGARLAVLAGHAAAVTGLIWVGEDRLISTDEQGKVLVWDVTQRRVIASLQTDGIISAALLAAPERLIVGNAAGKLRSFAYPGWEPLAEADLGSDVMTVAVAPDGQRLAVATADRRVRFFDDELQPAREMQTPPGKAFELRFSPDGRRLAGGGWFRIFLWATATGELEVRDTEHAGAVVSLDYSPDGRQLASIGRITGARLRITDAGSGALSRRLTTQPLCGWQVRFSPDGHYVASSSEDGSVFLYDMSIPYQPAWYHGSGNTE